MRKVGGMKLHRLLAALLSLVMLLSAVPAQARGLEGWENIEVHVLWTDASGSVWQYPAVQAPEDQGLTHAWWVTLPPEALGSTVQLQIVHPDPAYTYWTPDWTLNLQWFEDKNAVAVDDMYTYYVGYSYNGAPQVSQMQDCMKVLLSTETPPFALPEGEDFTGGPVLLPEGGGEDFGNQPGAELIPPGGQQGGTTAPAEAVITVYYKHVNGQTLDVRDVALAEGTHTLWPESTKVSGLNLAGDYSHTVTVYPGGYADELIQVLDYLLPEGKLFHMEYYTGQEEITESDRKHLEIPMAVLVNADSYSAAEFFAVALQEYEAATVVGERTSGKGYFQTTINLKDGSAVGLSVGKYYTPKGISLEGVGITPDVEVTVDEETYLAIYYGWLEPEEDPQIQAALELLN